MYLLIIFLGFQLAAFSQDREKYLEKVELIKKNDPSIISFIKGKGEEKTNLNESECLKIRGASSGVFYGYKEEAFSSYNRTVFDFDCSANGKMTIDIFQTENTMKIKFPTKSITMAKSGNKFFIESEDVLVRIDLVPGFNMYYIYGLYKTKYPFIMYNRIEGSKKMPTPKRPEI